MMASAAAANAASSRACSAVIARDDASISVAITLNSCVSWAVGPVVRTARAERLLPRSARAASAVSRTESSTGRSSRNTLANAPAPITSAVIAIQRASPTVAATIAAAAAAARPPIPLARAARPARPLMAPLYPSKRYPLPRTVRMRRGLPASGSIFWRSQRM